MKAVTSMVEALRPPVPLGWNFPLAPFITHDALRPSAQALGGLIRQRQDQFLPMGYYGARHPFLQAPELEQDLRRTIETPLPGLSEGTDRRPAEASPLLMPSQLDLCREESLQVYRRLGRPLISGPSVPQEDGWSYMTAFREGRDSSHPAQVFSGGASCPLGILRKRLKKKKEPVFLLFNGIDRNNRTIMEELLTLLCGRSQRLAGREIMPAGTGSHLPCLQRGHPYMHTIPLRDRSALIETHRHREAADSPGKTQQTADAVLDLAAPNTPYQKVKTGGSALNRLKDRDLIANMPGQVEHVNHQYSAVFNSGRFCGFRQKQIPDLLIREAQSYLEYTEGRIAFEKVSAFSIEDTHLCGMREILTAPTPIPEAQPGRITVDYLFPEDIEEMLLLATVRYPDLPPDSRVSSYIPLEIALFTLRQGERLLIRGNEDSPLAYQWPLPLREGIFQFPGNCFTVQKENQEVSISFPQAGQKITEGLIFRIQSKKRDTYTLTLCPDAGFGDISASEVSGFETHFSMLISPVLPAREAPEEASAPAGPSKALPSSVQQEVLPRAVFRHEEDLSAPAG